MTTATEANTYGAERTVVPLGGFNTTLLRLEFRRLTRNRRTMIFTLVMPVVFFLVFGLGQGDDDHGIGHGNVAAYIMISMALYGAMLATTSGGAMVSIERASGWSRQLRLTPDPGRLHRRQTDHGDAARSRLDSRGLRRRRVHLSADGRITLVHNGIDRLAGIVDLRGLRPVHGVPTPQ